MDRALLDEATALARALWRAYLLEPSEAGGRFIMESVDLSNLSIIGTGKHEMYVDAPEFLAALSNDLEGAQDISFDILDDYYVAHAAGEACCVVMGTLWVRERTEEPKPFLVEMDTRFTMVLHRDAGRWQLVHLHHSTPNVDQRRDEYYPKTATERVNEAIAYSQMLEHRASLDSMTELLNRASFEHAVSQALAQGAKGAVFAMIDLDDFKLVNDTLGHPGGDRVIVAFAELLADVFSDGFSLARMGGDEFAVFALPPCETALVEERVQELIDGWTACSAKHGVSLGCSVGLARVGDGALGFHELYRRADEALYRSKRMGKNGFSWPD